MSCSNVVHTQQVTPVSIVTEWYQKMGTLFGLQIFVLKVHSPHQKWPGPIY